MYSDVFCKVYNEFGWTYYPEIFGQQLLLWQEKITQMDVYSSTITMVPKKEFVTAEWYSGGKKQKVSLYWPFFVAEDF